MYWPLFMNQTRRSMVSFFKKIYLQTEKFSLGHFWLRPLGNWDSNTYVMYHCRVLLTDFFSQFKNYKKVKGMKAVLRCSLFSSFLTVCNCFTNCETSVIGKPIFLLLWFSQSARSTWKRAHLSCLMHWPFCYVTQEYIISLHNGGVDRVLIAVRTRLLHRGKIS